MDVLEFETRQPFAIRIDGGEFLLEFTVAMTAELERRIKRPMKQPADWFRMTTEELPAVLEIGFSRHYPEDAKRLAGVVCDGLNPESIETVIQGICGSTCPGFTRKWKEAEEKIRERVKKGLPLPNVLSGDGV